MHVFVHSIHKRSDSCIDTSCSGFVCLLAAQSIQNLLPSLLKKVQHPGSLKQDVHKSRKHYAANKGCFVHGVCSLQLHGHHFLQLFELNSPIAKMILD